MSPSQTFDIADLYRAGRRARLQDTVQQWCCLGTLSQYRWVYDAAVGILEPGMRVLDWGCGNGHFSFFLASRPGLQIDAYSFDETPAFMAKSPGCVHSRGSSDDPVGIPYDDKSFDIVFSIGVLEHVYETGGVEVESLSEIRRILKPNGRFMCFHFPNAYGWIEPVGRLLGVAPHFHYRKYHLSDIERLCKSTGFEIQYWRRYNFFPRNQLWRLPRALSDTAIGVSIINAVDDVFNAALGRFSQNYGFIARLL